LNKNSANCAKKILVNLPQYARILLGGLMMLRTIERYSHRTNHQERQMRRKFAVQLIATRNRLGISQAAAAKRMNISVDLVKRIELGKVSPNLAGLKKKVDSLENKKILMAL